MLVPVQTSGSRPPLFFVHGVHGVMPLGPLFARALGPDQPLYVIQADGIDGLRPVLENVPDMARAYVEQIGETWPAGPLRVAGMCSGCFLAMEMAHNLTHRPIGPLILADPPAVPLSYHKRTPEHDPRQPEVALQLYQQVRQTLLEHASQSYNEMPFDSTDPRQMQSATLTGVASLVASASHIPVPFPGPAEVILSAERAPGFFHPQMPWRKLLPGPRIIHVLPWDHHELFRGGRYAVARLLKFMLDQESAMLATFGEPQAECNIA
jgi:thioesterase domain-containing protein